MLGATALAEGGTCFRVWAPRVSSIEVELYSSDAKTHYPLEAEADGYYATTVELAQPGQRYRYRLDGQSSFPDPASRSQPEGVHGPSEIVNPTSFAWTDQGWAGLNREGLVLYELHVGTFSPPGTFDGVVAELERLADLGISALELLPVAAFPGRWNWGYDGVDLFAPCAVYGGPDGLRRLVDAAHRIGLGVLLDVVYNHLGPDGNYLRMYAEEYFTDRHSTPWGDAVNFDGPGSAEVRRFVLENVRHWLDEYRLDGLRLDATHAIVDESPRHILAEIASVAHDRPRPAIVIAEDHRNLVRLIDPPARGGYGLDGVWADDFHHALRTYLTPEREGHFRAYSGRLTDVARTMETGFLHQGDRLDHRGQPRGTPVADQPAGSFVICIENHDQVGNRARGERLSHLVDRAHYLLASAALLLAPETLLIFQGQEYASSSPFQYFTDHEPELGKLVTAGRRDEFKQFAAFSNPARRAEIPDPQAELTFQRSRVDFAEIELNQDVYEFYRRLLELRRHDPVLIHNDRRLTRATTLGEDLLVIHRWVGGQHRLALLNFGPETVAADRSEFDGLPAGVRWETLWSVGEPLIERRGGWRLEPGSGVLIGLPAVSQDQTAG